MLYYDDSIPQLLTNCLHYIHKKIFFFNNLGCQPSLIPHVKIEFSNSFNLTIRDIIIHGLVGRDINNFHSFDFDILSLTPKISFPIIA